MLQQYYTLVQILSLHTSVHSSRYWLCNYHIHIWTHTTFLGSNSMSNTLQQDSCETLWPSVMFPGNLYKDKIPLCFIEICCLNLVPYQLSDKTSSKSTTQMSGTISNPGRWIYLVPACLCRNGCMGMCYVCRELLQPCYRLRPEERGSPGQGDSSSPSGLGIFFWLLMK